MLNHYRDYFKQAFSQRCRINPRYTLRAMARDLKISPSALSEILSGKKGLSPNKASSLADRLHLSAREKELFLALVEQSYSRRKKIDKARSSYLRLILEKTSETEQREKIASCLRHWSSFAILELTHLKQFQPDLDWIARSLGLSLQEAQLNVQELVQAGLLEIKNEIWKDRFEILTTTDGIPSHSVREMNLQLLEKAKWAIATQSVEERVSQSLVFSIPKDRFDLFKEKIYRLRDELIELCETSEEKDSVYCATLHLFPVTHQEISSPKETPCQN